jgi:hypothetical protein
MRVNCWSAIWVAAGADIGLLGGLTVGISTYYLAMKNCIFHCFLSQFLIMVFEHFKKSFVAATVGMQGLKDFFEFFFEFLPVAILF